MPLVLFRSILLELNEMGNYGGGNRSGNQGGGNRGGGNRGGGSQSAANQASRTSGVIRDNSGAIFKNDDRTKDTQPEYRGEAIVDGVEYWIAAWVNEKNNRKYFRLALTRKDDGGESGDDGGGGSDPDIPF